MTDRELDRRQVVELLVWARRVEAAVPGFEIPEDGSVSFGWEDDGWPTVPTPDGQVRAPFPLPPSIAALVVRA